MAVMLICSRGKCGDVVMPQSRRGDASARLIWVSGKGTNGRARSGKKMQLGLGRSGRRSEVT